MCVSVKRFNIKTEKDIEISMMANPSHLEVVGPVALGKTKSHQFYAND
uniref:Uncharacterized protein n=1 Tax=Romanomermis culicivorax TaxID=13658 RepID=A0A915JKE8_ROMCU